MKIHQTTFIDERLRLRESDLLIEFRTRDDEPVLVYVLWEHQSKVEPMMAWRILDYRAEIIRAWLQENPKAKELPYIHAVVLYQGKAGWNAPQDVAGLIRFNGPQKQDLSSWYDVVSIVDIPKVGWPEDLAVRLGLGLMRAVTLKQQCEWLVENGAALNRLLKETGGNISFQFVIEYILITEDEEKVIEALRQTPPIIEKKAMSFAETLEARGIEKGIEKGIERGIEKGVQKVIFGMLKNGISLKDISEMTGISLPEVKKLAENAKKQT